MAGEWAACDCAITLSPRHIGFRPEEQGAILHVLEELIVPVDTSTCSLAVGRPPPGLLLLGIDQNDLPVVTPRHAGNIGGRQQFQLTLDLDERRVGGARDRLMKSRAT
jgi:hypothetical protein